MTRPALRNRPRVRYRTRDRLTKPHLVAEVPGVTTVPPYLVGLLPDGVRLTRLVDGPPVMRRVALAGLQGRLPPGADAFVSRRREGIDDLPTLPEGRLA